VVRRTVTFTKSNGQSEARQPPQQHDDGYSDDKSPEDKYGASYRPSSPDFWWFCAEIAKKTLHLIETQVLHYTRTALSAFALNRDVIACPIRWPAYLDDLEMSKVPMATVNRLILLGIAKIACPFLNFLFYPPNIPACDLGRGLRLLGPVFFYCPTSFFILSLALLGSRSGLRHSAFWARVGFETYPGTAFWTRNQHILA